MRADFLHRAIEQRLLAERIERHVALVSPMQPVELHDAILRPIDGVGSFEPGLVEELVEQVQDRPGALPLLEYALLELWKQREPDGTLTWAAYHALGGVEGALAARADAILADHYTAAQQDELRQLLLRLVQPGEGAADTGRRARLDDLVPAGMSLEAVQLLLKPLVDERLLVTASEGAGKQEDKKTRRQEGNEHSIPDNEQTATVEISHEALIRAWPTFGKWIADARADLRFQIQLGDASKEWSASGRNQELLWSGLRLAQADVWIERARPRLNARDQAFLETSRATAQARHESEEAERRERERLLEERAAAEARSAAAERRNVSRLNVFLGISMVLLLITIAAGLYTLNQTNVATTFAAQSARYAARSATSEAVAQANAAQSAKDRTASEVQARIASAQAKAGESLFELGRGNANHALLLARASIVTDTQQPLLAVRAIREATQHTIPNQALRAHTDSVLAVAWSPDGKQVVTGSYDNTAKVWDVASRTVVATLEGHTGSVLAVAWSPDGKQIVTESDDKTAKIWDVASGQVVATLQGHTSVLAVAWSPDGKQIVTGSAEIWDVASRQVVATLQGHTSVLAVAWSPDGKQIAPASADGTAKVWIADNRPIIAELTRQVCNIFSDDEIRIEIPAWRGCTAELAAAKDDLAEYDRLRPQR